MMYMGNIKLIEIERKEEELKISFIFQPF